MHLVHLSMPTSSVTSGLRKCGLAVATIVVCFGGSTVARAQDESPAVVPYRPSVATPADLPAPGWPELEAGLSWAEGGGTARSLASPVTFKLAWNESWAVLIGTDAYDWQRAYDGSTAHSGGDTALTLKYKLPVNENLALGAQFGVALPTARPPIGTGRTDWGINTIASLDYPGVHVDINVAGVRLGAVDAGQGTWQGGWAVAASHPLDERFGITGEVSGLVQRGTSAQAQGLLALNYNVSRALVLDVAVAARLSGGAPDWQLMAGMTVRLGHWF
ncbi:MAG TPA: transporter [Casimicrobiaceae bacterium]|nr:transporter [Casimicrobiaceae bacterium]